MVLLAKYSFLGETSGYITLSYIFCYSHIFNMLSSTPLTLSHSQRHHFAPLDMDLQATTMGPSRGVKGHLPCFLQSDESAIGRFFRSAQSLLIGLDVNSWVLFPLRRELVQQAELALRPPSLVTPQERVFLNCSAHC